MKTSQLKHAAIVPLVDDSSVSRVRVSNDIECLTNEHDIAATFGKDWELANATRRLVDSCRRLQKPCSRRFGAPFGDVDEERHSVWKATHFIPRLHRVRLDLCSKSHRWQNSRQGTARSTKLPVDLEMAKKVGQAEKDFM